MRIQLSKIGSGLGQIPSIQRLATLDLAEHPATFDASHLFLPAAVSGFRGMPRIQRRLLCLARLFFYTSITQRNP